MTDLAKHQRADRGILMPGQKLTEPWEVEFTRPYFDSKIQARVDWPHPVVYGVRGEGDTIEEARLDLVRALAAAVAEDHDPHLASPEAREGLALAAEAARQGYPPAGPCLDHGTTQARRPNLPERERTGDWQWDESIVIYVFRRSSSAFPWTARAYRHGLSGERLWSSEGAVSLQQALNEVGRGIKTRLASPRGD